MREQLLVLFMLPWLIIGSIARLVYEGLSLSWWITGEWYKEVMKDKK